MEGLNEVTLLGSVGKDPEIRVISENQKVANFTFATNESYTDKGGQKVENTTWHTIEAWGYTADMIASYIKKGQNLLIKGKIKYDSFEDKQVPGRKVHFTKIVADKIKFIPSGNRPAENQTSIQQQPVQYQQQPVQQQPVQQQPVQQQPVQQQPVQYQQQPVQQQPVQYQQQPVQQQPVQYQQQPVQQQPVQQQPVQHQVNQYMTDTQFLADMQRTPDDLPF